MDLKEQAAIADYYKKYSNTAAFRQEIEALQQKLPVILDDYTKYYIFFNKNPEVSEYQNMFENMESNMQETNTKLANIVTNISENMNEINSDLLDLNEKIEIEKTKNKRFNHLLGNVKNEENGATEMIDDYTEIYNMFYLRNIAMVIGIFGCIFIAKKVATS